MSYGSNRSRYDAGGRVQAHDNHMAYEEIETYVECPTCQGAGRINKDTETEYLALIPLTDKRLRPRRTYLYVGITFAICVIIIVLLVIFLTPRSIYLHNREAYIEPDLTVLTTEGEKVTIFMILTNKVNLTNGNFFGITVSRLTMEISMNHQILVPDVTVNPNVWVGALGRAELAVKANVTMNDQSEAITRFCKFDDTILRTLDMDFAFTVTATYNGQHMQAAYTSHQRVDCYPTANRTTTNPSSIMNQAVG